MNPNQIYLSTIAPDAADTAKGFGLGLEIAEYCTAWNMDEKFAETHGIVEQEIDGVSRRLLHAPFSELFPCAVDPKARDLARFRYRQAISLAKRYGAEKVIIHGGYNPRLYFSCWYTEQSIVFWKDFLKEDPGVDIVLENVLEGQPEMLGDIMQAVDHPRLRLCLDVGHVNAYSPVPAEEWLKKCAPWLSHFHIHNNDGTYDSHSLPGEGTIPLGSLLRTAETVCPGATFTLEVRQAAPAVLWLQERGILEDWVWKQN